MDFVARMMDAVGGGGFGDCRCWFSGFHCIRYFQSRMKASIVSLSPSAVRMCWTPLCILVIVLVKPRPL